MHIELLINELVNLFLQVHLQVWTKFAMFNPLTFGQVENMTNFVVSVHFGQKNIELAIALEALAHVGSRPVRDAAGKGILRKSAGVRIGNNRLLAFAKYFIFNDIKIRFAVTRGSPLKPMEFFHRLFCLPVCTTP